MFIICLDAFVAIGDGSVHEVKGMFAAAELFLLLEGVVLDFYFFKFIGKVELLAGHPIDFFLAISALDAFESFFMIFIVAFDTVQLHYPHGGLIYLLAS
jgi:hypothetical protein